MSVQFHLPALTFIGCSACCLTRKWIQKYGLSVLLTTEDVVRRLCVFRTCANIEHVTEMSRAFNIISNTAWRSCNKCDISGQHWKLSDEFNFVSSLSNVTHNFHEANLNIYDTLTKHVFEIYLKGFMWNCFEMVYTRINDKKETLIQVMWYDICNRISLSYILCIFSIGTPLNNFRIFSSCLYILSN
jgi:hypothetical protein